MKGARNLEFDKLREICGDYQELNYAKGMFAPHLFLENIIFIQHIVGAVELPLHCAQAFDTDLQGQEYWIAGCPANDPRAQYWERRKHCYELVLDSLSVFEERCVSSKQGATQTDDPETVRGHAYELAFASEDEMFHSTRYDWLISRGMADELLEVGPEYLGYHRLRSCSLCADEASISRGTSKTRTSERREAPASLEILCQGRSTITCCRGSRNLGGVDRVSSNRAFSCQPEFIGRRADSISPWILG